MEINDLLKLVSALQQSQKNVDKFEKQPENFVQKFLGSNMNPDTLNAIIAGIGANFLGQKQANAVDKSSGIDFNSLIARLAVAKFDTNGDGKLDLADLPGLASNFLGGNKQNTQQQNSGGLDLGMLGALLKGLK